MKKVLAISFLTLGCSLSLYLFTASDDTNPRSPASFPDNYDMLSACEKQEILWSEVESSAYKKVLPEYQKFGALQLLKMATQRLSVKGELHADFAPKGWKKYLHRRGVIGKVEIVPRVSKYTGIFKGAECGLLRLSLTYKPAGKRPVAPGLALKILRDGVPSANISALVSLDGQEKNFNFFQNPMSNIVPIGNDLGQKIVHRIFARVSKYPEELLVTDLAAVDANGVSETSTIAPRQLFFVPNPKLEYMADEHDVREDLMQIPAGTVIYQIHALSEKYVDFDYGQYTSDKASAFLKDSEHVADIISTSAFLASEFSDDGIFFRHQIRQ